MAVEEDSDYYKTGLEGSSAVLQRQPVFIQNLQELFTTWPQTVSGDG